MKPSITKVMLLALVAVTAPSMYVACSDSPTASGSTNYIATQDFTNGLNSDVTGAFGSTVWTFPSGIPGYGITTASTLSFTPFTGGAVDSMEFHLTSTTDTLHGYMKLNTVPANNATGSCSLRTTASNMAGWAVGVTKTVTPCKIKVLTNGKRVNTIFTLSTQLTFGTVASDVGFSFDNSQLKHPATGGATDSADVILTVSGYTGITVGKVPVVPVSGGSI